MSSLPAAPPDDQHLWSRARQGDPAAFGELFTRHSTVVYNYCFRLTGSWKTRWAVSTPEKGAEAIVEAGLGGKPERYVPKAYGLAAVARVALPRLTRKVMGGGGAQVMTTRTGAMDADER